MSCNVCIGLRLLLQVMLVGGLGWVNMLIHLLLMKPLKLLL